MPRSLSYLLVIIAGLLAGPFVAGILWLNPLAAVLGMYAAGLVLFLLSTDAVLSSEGIRGFFRDATEGARHLAVFLISIIASTGTWIAVLLLAFRAAKRLLGPLLPLGQISEHITSGGPILLVPIFTLGAMFAIMALLEFSAPGTRWWARSRALIMEGARGRAGLVLLAMLIDALLITILRREIQWLAIMLTGLAIAGSLVLIDRLLPRSRTWAVARQTVAEAMHYKIVVVWVIVMLLLIFALPPAISGDGLTLKSRVQSYLQVTLSIIGGGLGLLTVGLSAYTLPNEINRKLIFMTTSKPIPRWQIFVGKWIGIGVLNAGLLLFSGAAVWGFTWYLKNEPATEDDRMALEQEVLKVRHGIPAEEPPDLAARVESKIRELRESGDLSGEQEDEQRKTRLAELQRGWRSLAPQGADQVYTFRNLMVDREKQDFVHIRLKPNSPSGVDDLIFPIEWQAGDPADQNTITPVRQQEVPAKRASTIVVPAWAVGADGTLRLHVWNGSPRDTMIFEAKEDFELLYGIGTFHWNLARAMGILWCRLAFVAAMGLFLSTLLSFPVAFVFTMLLFLVSQFSGFLTESIDAVAIRPDGTDPFWGSLRFGYVLVPVAKAVIWSVPNFSQYDASENVVDGKLVPLMWLAISVVKLVACGCVAMGALGCVLLTQRELARDGT